MIAPVDQGDFNRCSGKTMHRLQSAEACADDDDAMLIRHKAGSPIHRVLPRQIQNGAARLR